MHFSVQIKKEPENDKTVKYKIKFIESLRVMSSSLSSLIDVLPDELHNNKCKDCKYYLEYIKVKDKLLVFNCLDRNKNYEKVSDKNLTKRFANTYEFCNEDINKFL